MTTPLTKQVLTILAEKEKPVYLTKIFKVQTITRHQTRLGLLLRDLEDKRYINSINTAHNMYIQYQITPTGLECYENEVRI